MSAFVVDPSCMDRCVRTLTAKGRYGQIVRRFAGIDTDTPGAATEIGRRLFTLNVEAVMQRYPDTENDPSNMPGSGDCMTLSAGYRSKQARPAFGLTRAQLVDGVKALRCLSYQCSEGDVVKADLYRDLQAAIGEVCEHIVSELPEYSQAEWG
jgi:hypothetical protein